MLDTYQLNLVGLLVACGTLLAATTTTTTTTKNRSAGGDGNSAETETKSGEQQRRSKADGDGRAGDACSPLLLQWPFFVSYALVMGSDWLQVR